MKELEDLEATGTIKLLPPGFWVFVSINMLFLITSVVLIFNVGISFNIPGKNLFVFAIIFSLFIGFLFTTASFLIIKGFSSFVIANKIFILVIFMITITQLFIFSQKLITNSNIFLLVLSTLNLYLVYSRPFKVFYMYSAKVREIKLEEYEEFKKDLQKHKANSLALLLFNLHKVKQR